MYQETHECTLRSPPPPEKLFQKLLSAWHTQLRQVQDSPPCAKAARIPYIHDAGMRKGSIADAFSNSKALAALQQYPAGLRIFTPTHMVHLTPAASTMVPKSSPNKIKVVCQMLRGEVGITSTFAPKMGPLGLSPNTVSDDIAKTTSDCKGLRMTVKLTFQTDRPRRRHLFDGRLLSDGDRLVQRLHIQTFQDRCEIWIIRVHEPYRRRRWVGLGDGAVQDERRRRGRAARGRRRHQELTLQLIQLPAHDAQPLVVLVEDGRQELQLGLKPRRHPSSLIEKPVSCSGLSPVQPVPCTPPLVSPQLPSGIKRRPDSKTDVTDTTEISPSGSLKNPENKTSVRQVKMGKEMV
ncbi:hypothetical protein A6R68_12143 [Neotoma lepida]|uniref:Large ribosomal subunit protein uL11 N-terminal domain-containing protein n=1 Tax=Neotoma lepida TaxID=56216 RepID=A0A1A6H4P7_NEOLE|nr:hypothetical protein A6R68_12143 [Neotoma lepida]